MSIRSAIAVLNRMEREGIIGRYAVGGAIAATFYLEPSATEDIDVFVALPQRESGFLSLTPIYDYLIGQGYPLRGPYVILGNWPVQFLPPPTPLVEEALEQAVEMDLEGETVRVFTAEHLAAIALQLARPKDRLRLVQFLEEEVVCESKLLALFQRHDLFERWTEFKRRILDPL